MSNCELDGKVDGKLANSDTYRIKPAFIGFLFSFELFGIRNWENHCRLSIRQHISFWHVQPTCVPGFAECSIGNYLDFHANHAKFKKGTMCISELSFDDSVRCRSLKFQFLFPDLKKVTVRYLSLQRECNRPHRLWR